MTGTERRLLEAAQQDDRAAIEQILRRYERLIWRVVWSLHPPPGCEREDLAQEARIGLLAAIRAWQPQRGPFPAFARHCVRIQALLAVKAAGRHKHQFLTHAISLSYEYGGDTTATEDGSSLALIDALPATGTGTDPEMRLLVSEQLRTIMRAVPSLTERERRALAGTLDGRSYAELGPIIGGSPKAASHAADRARRKLAGALRQAA
jgi:RNA polymerase sporulation-specific sigma factor